MSTVGTDGVTVVGTSSGAAVDNGVDRQRTSVGPDDQPSVQTGDRRQRSRLTTVTVVLTVVPDYQPSVPADRHSTTASGRPTVGTDSNRHPSLPTLENGLGPTPDQPSVPTVEFQPFNGLDEQLSSPIINRRYRHTSETTVDNGLD